MSWFLYPFGGGFFGVAIVGSLMSLSSSHWLGVWLGLEINLLGVLPLFIGEGGDQSVESSIKYFLLQALGSAFVLFGGFCCFWSFWGGETGGFGGLGQVLLLCGLMVKLGMFPFHWWVPSVMGGLNWFGCFLLSTWQKLAPFLVLVGCVSLASVLPFCVLSLMVGGFGGLGQVQVRLIMAYSSISHVGWMVSVSCFSLLYGLFYYLLYFLLSGSLFFILWLLNLSRVSGGAFSSRLGLVWCGVLGFISLGGLPPFSGFLGKLIGFWSFLSSGELFLSGLMLVGSLLSLCFYLNVSFCLFVSKSLVGWGVKEWKGTFFVVSGALVIFLSFFPLFGVFSGFYALNLFYES